MENELQNKQANQTTVASPALSQSVSLALKSRFPLIIVGLVLLFLVGGGAYYLGTQSANKQQPQTQVFRKTSTVLPTEVSSFSITPSISTGTKTNKGLVTIDQTTNEKIYTSSVVHYSIRVLKDWEINDEEGISTGALGDVLFAPAGTDTYNPFTLKLSFTTSDTGNTRFQYGSDAEFQQQLAAPVSNGTGQRLYKIGAVKVDENDAIQFVKRTLPGDQTEPYYAVVTWVRHNGLNYYFDFGPNEKGVKDNLATYNKIISTVTFTK